MTALLQRLRERLYRKRAAYRDLFLRGETRPTPAAAVVLADLRKFCGFARGGLVVSPVTRTTDPYATAYRNGMRDVYIRILMMTGLEAADVEGESDERPESAEQ